MNGASQPVIGDTRVRGDDAGSACRSWRLRRETEVLGALTPDSHPASSAGTSGIELDSRPWMIRPLIDAFTEAWEQGEVPIVEDYLGRLGPANSLDAVELIYREYCLAEADGHRPDPSSYLARFPRHRESLERLLRLHGACSSSMLGAESRRNRRERACLRPATPSDRTFCAESSGGAVSPGSSWPSRRTWRTAWSW